MNICFKKNCCFWAFRISSIRLLMRLHPIIKENWREVENSVSCKEEKQARPGSEAPSKQIFLVARTRFYNRYCRSVRRPVRLEWHFRKHLFALLLLSIDQIAVCLPRPPARDDRVWLVFLTGVSDWQACFRKCSYQWNRQPDNPTRTQLSW